MSYEFTFFGFGNYLSHKFGIEMQSALSLESSKPQVSLGRSPSLAEKLQHLHASLGHRHLSDAAMLKTDPLDRILSFAKLAACVFLLGFEERLTMAMGGLSQQDWRAANMDGI